MDIDISRADARQNEWFIFDIDGTLADCSHRLHHIRDVVNGKKLPSKKQDWDAFNADMKFDIPFDDVLRMNAMCVSLGYNICLMTGRKFAYLSETTKWMHDYGIGFDQIYMRSSNDHRSDVEVKQELYGQFRRDNPDAYVCGVFEDRTRVVRLWRSLGLTCYQVKEGDY